MVSSVVWWQPVDNFWHTVSSKHQKNRNTKGIHFFPPIITNSWTFLKKIISQDTHEPWIFLLKAVPFLNGYFLGFWWDSRFFSQTSTGPFGFLKLTAAGRITPSWRQLVAVYVPPVRWRSLKCFVPTVRTAANFGGQVLTSKSWRIFWDPIPFHVGTHGMVVFNGTNMVDVGNIIYTDAMGMDLSQCKDYFSDWRE